MKSGIRTRAAGWLARTERWQTPTELMLLNNVFVIFKYASFLSWENFRPLLLSFCHFNQYSLHPVNHTNDQ